jgi:SAM-dependent methyltransferase
MQDVTEESIAWMRCPECRTGGLALQDDALRGSDGRVTSGSLRCIACDRAFPIVGSVARFVPPENYAGSFGFQWNIHRETQLDSHSGLTISRDRVFGVSGWSEQAPGGMRGQRILEAGSGAGRFTEVLLSTGAEVWSFDFSAAVDANWKNNGHSPNLHLFQGDLFNIPFEERSFDKVFCFGVIQHTPDPERAFASLAGMVRPGGSLAIDVYAKGLLAVVSWKYLLRPITRRMDKGRLYRWVEKSVDALLPLAGWLRRVGGTFGARLVPIIEYSYLGLPKQAQREWAILDTFDIYAPAHDHPRSVASVRRWFEDAGFEAISVGRGPNGVVARGVRPKS